jgi:hypothetical protein
VFDREDGGKFFYTGLPSWDYAVGPVMVDTNMGMNYVYFKQYQLP